MTCTSLVYNNSLMSVEYFVDNILYPKIQKTQIPLCEIEETSNFYYINVKSFYRNKHVFEVYYKNNFLILQIKLRDSLKKTLITRMFYLTNINLRNISHTYSKDEVKLKLPKIYCN